MAMMKENDVDLIKLMATNAEIEKKKAKVAKLAASNVAKKQAQLAKSAVKK